MFVISYEIQIPNTSNVNGGCCQMNESQTMLQEIFKGTSKEQIQWLLDQLDNNEKLQKMKELIGKLAQ